MRLPLLCLLAAGCSVDWPLARVESASVLCDAIPALPADPTIDGRPDPGVLLYAWSEAHVMLALAHRPQGLYFFAAVDDVQRDPAPAGALAYCGDGIELFVDDDGALAAAPAYDLPGTMQLVVAAPGDDVTPARRGERFVFPGTSTQSTDLGAWTSPDFVAVPTATGYAVEAFVGAGDLGLATWTLAAGGKIGWDASLNIGGPEPPGVDACTTRSRQIHFRLAASGACTPPYCNASALCAPTLAGP